MKEEEEGGRHLHPRAPSLKTEEEGIILFEDLLLVEVIYLALTRMPR